MLTSHENKSLRRIFMQFFTTSPLRLGILNKGIGKREKIDQSNFRSQLIKIHNATRPNPNSDMLWCPILKQYHDRYSMTTAHIFAYRHGQETMTAIFVQRLPPIYFHFRMVF